MSEIVFVVPANGDQIHSPDLGWLRDIVLTGGKNYWCSGCGQGWLKHPKGTELFLSFAPKHGFFPEYLGPERDHWISLSEIPANRKVPVWIGGDPIIVSERFFVSAALAWIAVEEFILTGQRTNRLRWMLASSADWSFEYSDHPEVKLR